MGYSSHLESRLHEATSPWLRVMAPGCQVTCLSYVLSSIIQPLNSHVFKGSLKAINAAIVSYSSCVASVKLSITASQLYDTSQRGKVFPVWSASAAQLVSLETPAFLCPDADGSLSSATVWPLISHSAAALSSLSLQKS